MKFTLLSTSIISALALLPSTHAWWEDGHAIVATIAEVHLDPTVMPILCSILDSSRPRKWCSLASVASWADKFKKKWSKPMHYVNAVADHPPQLCLFPGVKGWEGDKDVNVLAAIRNTTDLLSQWVEQGSDPSDPIASEALKFLVHFVGDMHMPFHLVARARGANDVYVKWSNKKARLHEVWDGNVVERAIETTPPQWAQALNPEIERHLRANRYDPLIRKILIEGIFQTWSDEIESWIQCPTIGASPSRGGGPDDQTMLRSQWQASDTDDDAVCPWHWAFPIHDLTCEWIWPKKLDTPPYDKPNGPLLELDTDEYAGKITREWVVEKLLAMGGLRLASILNLIFAPPRDH